MARKEGGDNDISAIREALSGDEPEPSYEVETTEIDGPAGTARLPKGFDPSDYDDGDDGATPASDGITGDDPDPDGQDGVDPDGGEGEVEGEGDDAEPASDPDPDADDAESEGHDEPIESGEDGTPERPYSLGADELNTFVRAEGLDQPVRFADLVKTHQEAAKQREIYLKRSREHAETMQKAESALTQAQQVLASRTEAADSYDVPDVFLDHTLSDWLKNGLIPKAMADDVMQVFVDYHKAGEYDRNIGLKMMQERQQRDQAARTYATHLRDQAAQDLEYIESTTGTKLANEQKLQIVDVIQQYAADNNGQHLRVREAYLILKAQGHMVPPPPPAKPTPTKQQRRAKRSAAFGKVTGKVGAGSPAKTTPAQPKHLTKLQEARLVRRSLLGG